MKTRHVIASTILAEITLLGVAWVNNHVEPLAWFNVLVLAVGVLVLVTCIGRLIADVVIASKPANATWRERLERARKQKRTSEITNAPQEKA